MYRSGHRYRQTVGQRACSLWLTRAISHALSGNTFFFCVAGNGSSASSASATVAEEPWAPHPINGARRRTRHFWGCRARQTSPMPRFSRTISYVPWSSAEPERPTCSFVAVVLRSFARPIVWSRNAKLSSRKDSKPPSYRNHSRLPGITAKSPGHRHWLCTDRGDRSGAELKSGVLS